MYVYTGVLYIYIYIYIQLIPVRQVSIIQKLDFSLHDSYFSFSPEVSLHCKKKDPSTQNTNTNTNVTMRFFPPGRRIAPRHGGFVGRKLHVDVQSQYRQPALHDNLYCTYLRSNKKRGGALALHENEKEKKANAREKPGGTAQGTCLLERDGVNAVCNTGG